MNHKRMSPQNLVKANCQLFDYDGKCYSCQSDNTECELCSGCVNCDDCTETQERYPNIWKQ